jgi:pimeloyl-ACP methyl ester carboxylesterase
MPHVMLPDADIHYEVFGEGPPLMFLSATAWYGGVWKLHQVPVFSREHQVIIFDQRGTGRSATSGTDFSTERLAKDAIALLDHLGVSRTSICGHSNGGRVAQMLALDYPQRIEKMILASAGATHTSKGIPLGMCLELVEKGYPRYVRDHAIETGFTKTFVTQHPDKAELLLRELLDNLAPLEIFLGHVIGRQQSDTTSRLKDIRVPTLVMIGDDEDHGATSGATHMDFAKVLSRDIPGAKLVVFSGQGHYYLFTEPEKANRIIRDFLAGR